MPGHTCWGQKTTFKSQISPTMHVLGMKFRSSGLAANNLTHWVTLLTVPLVLASNRSIYIFIMTQHINHKHICNYKENLPWPRNEFSISVPWDHFNQQQYEFYKHLLFVSAGACSLCETKPVCVSGKVILSEARDCAFFSSFGTLGLWFSIITSCFRAHLFFF